MKFRLPQLEVAYFEAKTQLQDFSERRTVALDSLDPHIVVHFLLHKSGLCERFTFVTDDHAVQFIETRQVKQHIRLVVAQVAYRVVSIVVVRERCCLQSCESV